eukprot:EG_transcript_20616
MPPAHRPPPNSSGNMYNYNVVLVRPEGPEGRRGAFDGPRDPFDGLHPKVQEMLAETILYIGDEPCTVVGINLEMVRQGRIGRPCRRYWKHVPCLDRLGILTKGKMTKVFFRNFPHIFHCTDHFGENQIIRLSRYGRRLRDRLAQAKQLAKSGALQSPPEDAAPTAEAMEEEGAAWAGVSTWEAAIAMARKGLEAPALKEKVKVPSRPKVTEGDWVVVDPVPLGWAAEGPPSVATAGPGRRETALRCACPCHHRSRLGQWLSWR